jgi:hypothetical protein
MAYITITEADVLTKLSGPEIAAMKTAAMQAAQTNPLPEIIEQVVGEVRGRVAACTKNILGDGETIPQELLGAAINRIRFELATRLPVPGLLTAARDKANDQAIAMLRDVSRCEVAIVGPEVPAEEQPAGPGVEIVSSTTRKATRAKLAGL